LLDQRLTIPGGKAEVPDSQLGLCVPSLYRRHHARPNGGIYDISQTLGRAWTGGEYSQRSHAVSLASLQRAMNLLHSPSLQLWL
jgi:hypothetical protein